MGTLASRFLPLVLLPSESGCIHISALAQVGISCKFPRSVLEPRLGSRRLYTGHRQVRYYRSPSALSGTPLAGSILMTSKHFDA